MASAFRLILRNLWPMFPALALLIMFYAAPVSLILPLSLQVKGVVTTSVYEGVLGEGYYWTVLFRSFWLAFTSTVICALLGYPIAYYLVRVAHPRFKRYAYMIVIAPLFTSAVIRAIAWVVILGKKGIVNQALMALGLVDDPVRLLYSEGAVIIGLVYIMIPFMVLTVAAVLENVNRSLEEAAHDLGASRFTTFWKVTLPLTMPGVMAGGFLVFALCISSYVTPALLGGGRIKVLSMLIFEQFLRVFNWPLGAAIACILMVVTFFVMWAYSRMTAKRSAGGGAGALP